jgi:predicted enzyme related to lactoylglutathione lyase
MPTDTGKSSEEHVPGSACWIDLGVADTTRAAAFYEELFGWDIAPPDGSGYRLASSEGHLVAALGPAEDPGVPYWTVYLRTNDAAATAAAVQAGGGTVVAPSAQVGDAGVAATVRDPAGAAFALWQPLSHDGSWLSEAPGTLAGFQLRVEDLPAARQFWSTAIGWHLDEGGGIWCRTHMVGAWRYTKTHEAIRTASPWLIELRTDDLVAALHRATRLGATIVNAEHGLLCDPGGAAFRLVAQVP